MSKFVKYAVAAAVAFSMQAQAAVGDPLDDLSTVVQTVQDLTTGDGGVWAVQNAVASTSIFGGYRDIYVEKTDQPVFDGVRGVRAAAGGGEFSFSEDTNQIGYAILRYDGAVSNGDPLAPDLTSVLGDLTSFGSGFTFTYSSDFVFNIDILVYSSAGDISAGTQVTDVTGVGVYKSDTIQFSELVAIAGAGADLTSVRAIEIIFNGDLSQASIDLAFTPPIGVPEPTSVALAGLALLGLGAARRRKA